MLVGHTHDDIDQMFSRVSTYLHRNDATTLPKLHSAVKTSYSKCNLVDDVEEVLDWKEWFAPCRVPLHGHTKMQQFKIEWHRERVRLFCKDRTDSPMYEPLLGLEILKEGKEPRGPAPTCTVHKDLPLPELRRGIEYFSNYFDESEKHAWEDFFEHEDQREVPGVSSTWQTFVHTMETCHTDPNEEEKASNDAKVSEEGEDIVFEATEDDRPAIYTGAYRNRPRDVQPLKVGDWMALRADGHDGYPFWIVKCLSLDNGKINILWHECTKGDGTGKWYPVKKQNSNQWYTQDIEEDTILRFDIRMTTADKLFKKAYEKLVEEASQRNLRDMMQETNSNVVGV